MEIAPETIEVRKLNENMKILMEQKLGGGRNQSLKFEILSIFLSHLVFSYHTHLHSHPYLNFQHNPALICSGKLKKWNTVDEVHRTVEIPEAPNRKSGPVNVPLPPPPPPPPLPGGLKPPPVHLMKPLRIATDESVGPPSPTTSSFYSPGMKNAPKSCIQLVLTRQT